MFDVVRLGRLIATAREDKGWSQKVLSINTGIPQPTLCTYEAGKVSIPFETAVRLSDVLGISLDQMAGKE